MSVRTRYCWCVWYASAGCLPDTDEPEFVGTLAECSEWAALENAKLEADPARSEHDLYSYSVSEWECDDEV